MNHQLPPDNKPSRACGDGRRQSPQASLAEAAPAMGVLVVDDTASVRLVLQRLLEHNGFRVWLAPDGRTAIELYKRHRGGVAVVLLDVRMPGLDGPQTLNALRQLNPDVLACFMSADLGDYRPEELLHRGAQQLFAKPLPLNELIDLLRRLASGVPAGLSSTD